MVKSMTGFGKAEKTFENKKITVELRSLNSKQMDLSLRLPSKYRTIEYEIRSLISKGLVRGKVDAQISVESTSVETASSVNAALFGAYYTQVRQAQQAAGIPQTDDITAAILRMPDVVSQPSDTVAEAEHAAVLECVGSAIGAFDAFRTQEGAALIKDLLHRVDKIEDYKEQVVPFEKARIEAIRTRILDGLTSLGADYDKNRMEQELIFYIEKLDITEEKVRLKNHCAYFRTTAAEEQEVGRKLGFIAQEMGREINTLGSKANNTEIQILVVKMKDELEKIKEQVLNIL